LLDYVKLLVNFETYSSSTELIIAYANDFVIGAKIKVSDGPSDLASKIIGDRIFTYSCKGNEAGTAYPEVFIGAFNMELTEDFYKKFTYSDAKKFWNLKFWLQLDLNSGVWCKDSLFADIEWS